MARSAKSLLNRCGSRKKCSSKVIRSLVLELPFLLRPVQMRGIAIPRYATGQYQNVHTRRTYLPIGSVQTEYSKTSIE